MTLSVCMIAKNEENNIERCLKSIKEIADEIIVVDTGSTDRTVEIAEEYGAKTFYHEWNKDFSAARNKSIEQATKDWILFLDADEELPPEEGAKLKEILETQSQYEGFYLRMVNIINNTVVGDAIVFRAFKNKPNYRFTGKMHEQVINSIIANDPNCVKDTPVKINHYGYDPQLADLQQKVRRNIELLLSYEEKDKDGYYYYALGNEYARDNDIETAMETYKKALMVSSTVQNVPIYYAYLISSIMKVLHMNKRFKEELSYINSFEKSFADFRDIYFFKYLVYAEQCKISLAKDAMTRFLNCRTCNYAYPLTNFEADYNMSLIMQQLTNGCVAHQSDLISGVILVTEDDPSVIEGIRSMNEIVCETIVVMPSFLKINKEQYENYGATVLEVTCETINEYYVNAFKLCRGKYILILEMGEVLPFNSQVQLAQFLTNATGAGYFMYLVNKDMQVTSKSLRLFKNSEDLEDLDYASKFVFENKIEDCNIYLYKPTEMKAQIPQIPTDYIEEETDKKENLNGVSVCIIAKNEQRNIGRCLASVQHFADEIIVVDTGSDDCTAEIASYYGATVYYHPFNEDFGAARNAGLERATQKWILVLDCDEEIDFVDSFKLKELLQTGEKEGYCLALINWIDGIKNLSLPALRIFRNKEEYRFEGKIHEQIQKAIRRNAGEDAVEITEIKLYHYGYDNQYVNIEEKIKRNLSILENTPKEDQDGFYHYNLGNEYLRVNELDKAFKCYIKASREKDEIGYRVYLPIFIVNTLYMLKRYKDGIEYGKKFLKEYPNYKDLYFVISACLYELKKFRQCKEYLIKYKEYSKVDYGYPNFNFDTINNIDKLVAMMDNN